ncbi:hypothetical protein CL653_00605 [bacterium]|nr:hypothetical protein [bacterium]
MMYRDTYPGDSLSPGERLVETCGMVFVFDNGNNLVYLAKLDGKLIHLSKHPFRVMCLLARHPGNVVSFNSLCSANVQNRDYRCADQAVANKMAHDLVRKTRRALQPQIGADPICSVWGVGYKLEHSMYI